jgi:hypothetical protein
MFPLPVSLTESIYNSLKAYIGDNEPSAALIAKPLILPLLPELVS